MLEEKLSGLLRFTKETIEQLKQEDFKKYLSVFVPFSHKTADLLLEIGNTAFKNITEEKKTKEETAQNLLSHIITFDWGETAKSYQILIRDILFEQYKALVFFHANEVNKTELEQLRRQSEQTLLNAVAELVDIPEKKAKSLRTREKIQDKYLYDLSLQTNPWLVYQEQIKDLVNQSEVLKDTSKDFLFVDREYRRISELVRKNIIDCQSEIAAAEQSLSELIVFIEENAAESPNKIVKRLEEVERQGATIGAFPAQVSKILKKETNSLPELLAVPVSTEGGLVQVREINFRRQTRQWLESEILPQLYEVWEITESVRTGLKLSLLNIRNRALLMVNEIKERGKSEVSPDDLCRPLKDFEESALLRKEECAAIYTKVEERLNGEFHVKEVYREDRDFLEIPLQSTINQIVFGQSDVFDTLKKRWNKLLGTFRDLRTDVQREDALSMSEKVVRYLESRAPDPENHQYSAIFLTKGYVGESFRVGREEEIKRMEKLIKQWEVGYRGAVLLTGQRFSGKTLFGELTAEKYFAGNNIHLYPYSEIKVQGRSFTTTCDLKEALNFIKKYTQQSRSMLWIDNLETWASDSVSLAENVRALQKFTDDFSGKIFTVVALSNWLNAHLSKTMDFGRYFQAEINLDHMSKVDVSRAIAIRHGATHKKLVDEDGEVLSPQAFAKMASATYNHSQGNIGEALLSWANSLEKADVEKVRRHENPDPPLPDFLTSDTALLLTVIMHSKRTNEYELSKLFGSPWGQQYRGILQRLISLGLLTRSLDGRLQIAERAVNDIGRLLAKHRYLDF